MCPVEGGEYSPIAHPHAFHYICYYTACSWSRRKHVVTSHMHEWAKGVETVFLMLNNYYNKFLPFLCCDRCSTTFMPLPAKYCMINGCMRESRVRYQRGYFFFSERMWIGVLFVRSVTTHPFIIPPVSVSRRRPTPSLLAWPARWLKNINRQIVTNRPVSCGILSFAYYHIAYLLQYSVSVRRVVSCHLNRSYII